MKKQKTKNKDIDEDEEDEDEINLTELYSSIVELKEEVSNLRENISSPTLKVGDISVKGQSLNDCLLATKTCLIDKEIGGYLKNEFLTKSLRRNILVD